MATRLTYFQLIELREKVINDEIDLKLAKSQFWNNFEEGQRSWHTADWKKRRKKVLKNKCEICSSTETLTLQHLSHPEKYSVFLNRVAREYTRDYIDNNPAINQSEFKNHVLNQYEYFPVPLCPQCKARKPNKRVRKTPKYRCADCKHEFDEPDYQSVEELVSIFYEEEETFEVRDKCFVSKDKWRNRHNLSGIRYWLQRERAKIKNAERIEKKAFLLYLDDNIKYLSFKETITACKKCAASYDLYKMELCPSCQEYYKGIEYPTCVQCLPEEQRQAALEKIEFGKQWHQMHKELGID